MTDPIEISSDDEDCFQCLQEYDILPKAELFWAKRAKQDDIIEAWQQCTLVKRLNSGDHKYVVKFCSDGHQQSVAQYELATDVTPANSELIRGVRVIARRDNDSMPYILDNHDNKIPLYANECMGFYAGILSGHHDTYTSHLVFFDDGMVQYVSISHIKRVQGDYVDKDGNYDGYKHAHWNAKAYYEFMLQQENVVECGAVSGDRLRVELDGVWKNVTVQQIHFALALISFENAKRFEWIYLGSPRISLVYRNHIKLKSFDKLISYKTYKACLRATNDILKFELIDPQDEPKPRKRKQNTRSLSSGDDIAVQMVTHDCGPPCLRLNEQTDESSINTDKYPALQRPVMLGWKREKSTYKTPCGIVLRNYIAIHKYLVRTKSKLRIDCFELNESIKIPNIYIETTKNNDISKDIEPIPIVVRGQQMSMDFEYITDYNFDYIDTEPENNLPRTGCNCEDFCRDKSKCSCWQLTIRCLKQRNFQHAEYKRFVDIGYKNMRLQKDVETGIVECSSNCKCCTKQCLNRVVQNGMQHKLEIFNTKQKGWGVKTRSDLPEGVYVCHYAGDVLDEMTADQRDFRYQFRLPPTKVSVNDSDDDSDGLEGNYESNKENLMKKPRIERDQSFLNYFPPMENGHADSFPNSEFIEKKIKRFVIDALSHGNVSRFINHSCAPNLFSQKVFVNDDKRFPQIAFFTSRIIKAEEELTFDYAYELCEAQKTECHCGANNCRKRLM